MSKPDPRHYAQQRDFARQLFNFMSPEAIEILARVTAHVMARDPRLANLFKHALDREYTYLTTRHREGVS
jgi:hypothetical protein